MELSQLAFTIQTVAVPLAALVLWFHARAMPAPYLAYWTAAWAAQSLALISLRIGFWFSDVPAVWIPADTAYYCLTYGFGFLLWAGCRNLSTGRILRQRDLWLLSPALAFGVAAPWLLGEPSRVAPIHAPLYGAFFWLALAATRRPESGPEGAFGVHVVRICLIVLGVLYVHYGPVMYWCVYVFGDPYAFRYIVLSPMYNCLAQVGLAFGMTMVVTESLRTRLSDANRELAEANSRLGRASHELALAARTDPLTGLWNRRALEECFVNGGQGAVAVIDLNDLKILNDTWGHEAGDAALRIISRALVGHFRISDSAYRTGGDEFVVVSEGSHLSEVVGRMAEVDAAIMGQRLPGRDDPADLRIAWGVAEFGDLTRMESALREADATMYACKARRKAGVASE